MRKSAFLLGAGIGFILGSHAGRDPYQHLESKVREITGRPEVKGTVVQIKDAARDQAKAVADKVSPSESSIASNRVTPPNLASESYVDPQDLQFSTAAAEKEAMVDDLLEQGVPPAEMEQKEEELRRSGKLREPPAGNKPKSVSDR